MDKGGSQLRRCCGGSEVGRLPLSFRRTLKIGRRLRRLAFLATRMASHWRFQHTNAFRRPSHKSSSRLSFRLVWYPISCCSVCSLVHSRWWLCSLVFALVLLGFLLGFFLFHFLFLHGEWLPKKETEYESESL